MCKLQIQDIRHKIMVDNQLLIVLCELGYILKPKARGSLDHYLNTFCVAELKKKNSLRSGAKRSSLLGLSPLEEGMFAFR